MTIRHFVILGAALAFVSGLSACAEVIDPFAIEPPTIEPPLTNSSPTPPPGASESSLPETESVSDEPTEPTEQPTEDTVVVTVEPTRLPKENCLEPVGVDQLAELLDASSFLPICELVRVEWGDDEWAKLSGFRRVEDHLRGNFVSFSDHERDVLAVGSTHGKIRILNIGTGSMQEMNSAAGTDSQVSDLAFTQNGRFLVSTGLDQLMHKWTYATGALEVGPRQLALGARITALDLSLQNFAALGLDTGDLVAVDLASMETVGRESHVHGSGAQIWDISYDTAGSRIATVGSNNYSYLFETDRGGPFAHPGRRPFSWFVGTTVGYVSTIQAFNSDGADKYAIGTPDGKVHIFGTEGAEPILSSESVGASIWSLDVSPNGQLIAVGTDSGHVLIFTSKDLKTDEDSEFFIAAGYSEQELSTYVVSLSFSLDGRFIAVGHAKGVSILGVFD